MSTTPFFEPPNYNLDGRQQLWINVCLNSHDTWCGCDTPLVHLLTCLLPPGHKDRNLTVEELIAKNYQKKWPSGGTEDAAGTNQETTGTEREDTQEDLEKLFSEDAVEELLAAAAADERPR